jgi:hypothetical protein
MLVIAENGFGLLFLRMCLETAVSLQQSKEVEAAWKAQCLVHSARQVAC